MARRKIPFDLPKLDEIVGGYPINRVIMFYGRPGSGKTHFAIYHPVFQLLKYRPAILRDPGKNKILIVSADRSIDYDRFEELAEVRGIQASQLWDVLLIYDVNTWEELKRVVCRDMIHLVKNQQQRIHMIAIDPLTNLYRRRLLQAEGRQMLPTAKQLQGDLEEMFAKIFAVTGKFDGIITITSWARKANGETDTNDWYREFYGGLSIAHYPSVVIKLRILSKSPKIVMAEVVKNRLGEEGAKVKVKITKKGLEEVG